MTSIRRLVLDVDKAIARPDIVELAAAIEAVRGVEAVNVTVTEIDLETVGMNVTIEGDGLDYHEIARTIEGAGAVVNSVDQVVCGTRILESIRRER